MREELYLSLECFILTQEIKKAIVKMEYFTFHIGRCKKEHDKIKLNAILRVHIWYVNELYLRLNKTRESLFKTLKLKP